jgi:type VI secretion system protein ImpL
MTTLKKALEDFFAMKFADIENAQSSLVKELPPNTRVVWNTQLLAQAVKLFEPYNQFLSEKLNDFPVELQPIFEQVSRQSLETNMTDLISRAQKLETIPKIVNPSFKKEALRSEVLNFKESSQHISELLGIFDRLELHKTNRTMFMVVAIQGNRILEEIDQLLQEDNLYMVKDGGFGWWNGQKSPVFAAYNVNDTDELKYYFGIQRDRIRFLTNEYSLPVISLLGYQNIHRGYVNLPLVKKWERIIAAFESYEKKKPGNSIDILEDFILNGINDIAAKNCSKEIPNRVLQAKSDDFFLVQRNELRKKIYQRCQHLSFEKEVREF